MRKHLSKILIGIFAGILLAGIFFMRLLSRESSPTPIGQSSEPLSTAAPLPQEETIYTAAAIAKRTLFFLNQQRRTDGFYHYFSHYERLCPETAPADSCPLGSQNVREDMNTWIILARLAYYDAFSHDPADLQMAAADAEALFSYCRTTTDGCLAAPIAFTRLYGTTNDDTYRRMTNNVLSLPIDLEQLDVTGLALEAWSRSTQMQPDTALQPLRMAETQAAQESEEWAGSLYPYTCDLTRAQIAVAQSLGLSEKLAEAVTVLRRQPLQEFSTQTGVLAGCVESAFLLGDLLNDPELTQQAADILGHLVAERWDEPGYPRAFGEGGFLSDEGSDTITVSDAAHILITLSYAPQQVYSLPVRETL